MTIPGLSHFAGGATRHSSEESRVVPKSLQSCTPIAVKVIAGLRLFPDSQSADILHAVEQHILSYSFKLQEKNGSIIMDGADEGVYA